MPTYVLGVSRRRDLPRLMTHMTAESGPARRCSPADVVRWAGRDHVWWITRGDLTAAVVRALQGPPQPVDHARILAAIHRRICVVPMRYGTAGRDDEAVGGMLEEWSRDLLRSLDRLEGTCELGVRIALAHQPASERVARPAGLSPTDYLAWRRTEYRREDDLGRRAREVIQRVTDAAEGLYFQRRCLPASAPALVRLSFLVERSGVESFRRRVGAFDLQKTAHRYTLLGPWPPYSFA